MFSLLFNHINVRPTLSFIRGNPFMLLLSQVWLLVPAVDENEDAHPVEDENIKFSISFQGPATGKPSELSLA